MVKAIVEIDEHANQILNIIKAQHSLRDKSEAINLMAERYEEEILEPGFKPEFVERLKRAEKEPTKKIKSFAKEFGLE